MGADIKQLKNRIKSVDSTLHITKAMKLVASSKIHKADLKRKAVLPFSKTVEEAVYDMLSGDCLKSPFVSIKNENAPTCYIVIESDRGLAGSFNGNVSRMAASVIKEGDTVIPIGKRACEFCKSRYEISLEYPSVEKITDGEIKQIADEISGKIVNGEYSRVEIIYTACKNALIQEAETKTVLPLTPKKAKASLTVYEPSVETVLNTAVPMYLISLIRSCVAESFLSEQYARRNAMDSASENASEMIDSLNLKYNRARQNTITQEITEIVAGAGFGD